MNNVPFSLDVPICSYQYYAYPLGVFKAKNPLVFHQWFYGKFINLVMWENLQFYEIPAEHWDVWASLPSIILSQDRCIESIVSSIKVGHPVLLWNINERFIPQKASYLHINYLHDTLITGEFENQFQIVGYNAHRVYAQWEVPKSSILQSLVTSSQSRVYILKNKFDICLPNPYELYQTLTCYFDGKTPNTNPYLFSDRKPVFGINIYEHLINRIQILERDDTRNDICLLNEHKHVIKMNMMLLSEQNIVSSAKVNEYEKIVRISDLLKILYTKFLLTNSNKDFIRCVDKLKELEQEERNFIFERG